MSDDSRSPPTLRAGAQMDAADLADLARSVLKTKGKTHEAAAEDIGVKRPAVSRALSEDSPGVPICTKLLEHYTGYTADPTYRLRKMK